jgi:hypothetical protein
VRRTILAVAAMFILAVVAQAPAASMQPVTIDFDLFPFLAGASSVSGDHVLHERGALESGLVFSTIMCCEISMSFDRNTNLDSMRGGFSGSLGVSGNPLGTVWTGDVHGTITPDGATGTIVATDNAGERLVGTFTQFGHRTTPCCAPLAYRIEGTLITLPSP